VIQGSARSSREGKNGAEGDSQGRRHRLGASANVIRPRGGEPRAFVPRARHNPPGPGPAAETSPGPLVVEAFRLQAGARPSPRTQRKPKGKERFEKAPRRAPQEDDLKAPSAVAPRPPLQPTTTRVKDPKTLARRRGCPEGPGEGSSVCEKLVPSFRSANSPKKTTLIRR